MGGGIEYSDKNRDELGEAGLESSLIILSKSQLVMLYDTIKQATLIKLIKKDGQIKNVSRMRFFCR